MPFYHISHSNLGGELATSGGFSPFGAYGTTFAPVGSVSLDFRVTAFPYKSSSLATPLYRSGDIRKAPLWAGQAPYFARLAHPMQDVHSGQ